MFLFCHTVVFDTPGAIRKPHHSEWHTISEKPDAVYTAREILRSLGLDSALFVRPAHVADAKRRATENCGT